MNLDEITRPCPICGGKMEAITDCVKTDYENPDGDNPPMIVLQCKHCGLRSPEFSCGLSDEEKEIACNALIFYWNNRKPDTPNADALTPCPNCGGTATMNIEGGWDGYHIDTADDFHMIDDPSIYLYTVYIYCDKCGVSTPLLLQPSMVQLDAIRFLWNYRQGKGGASWLGNA